jgi:hypothetical protein
MPEIKQTLNLGDLLKFEEQGFYSRQRVTLLAGQTLVLGTVLGQVSASGKVKALDPSATDGSEVACGVLLQDCDAYLSDRDDALMLARHGTVAQHALTWPATITQTEREAAQQQLQTRGILVHRSA